MNDPMMRPPAQYQMWPAPAPPPAAAMEMLPVVFVGGGKPARPAWKRVARQPGWKRKAPPAATAARWGGAAAPRNTTSYLIRAKRAGGVASLVSPCPVTPAVLPTPQLSPAREVVGEMAKEKWGVDGYGSMKGLIRLRSQVASADADAGGLVLAGEDSGSGESDVEEHVEVERRLDHDLSRFEMVQLPAAAGEDDDEARAARLEEENLTLRERLFLMERDMDDLRRRLLAVESLFRDRHRDGCVVDAAAVVAGAEETVLSESVAGVDLAGVGDDTVTAADAMKA